MTEPADDDIVLQLQGLSNLRTPFNADEIDKLPRGVAKDGPKQHCNICGGYHRHASVHLDYVGHAHATNRLLTVDPYWDWEPLSYADDGLPQIRQVGNTAELWIRLTICGVTRLGVGTANAGKDEVSKELIGDAIRNAAMRFGVALDLWAKSDLGGSDDAVAADSPEVVAAKQTVVAIIGDAQKAADFWHKHRDLDTDAIVDLAGQTFGDTDE